MPDYGGYGQSDKPMISNPADAFGRFWNDISGKTASNSFNSAEAQKARDFEAAQAQINRDYNSAEAMKQRDWEAMMSNTAYQRQVADMKAAGLNPAAAYLTSGGASSPSGSAATAGAVPNGSAAHSASGDSGGVFGLLAHVAGGILGKVAGAKIMAKASSAKDAAQAAATVQRETLRAQNAMKMEEYKKVLKSKAYWQKVRSKDRKTGQILEYEK